LGCPDHTLNQWRRPAVGQARRRWTFDDDDDGLGVGQGGEDPIIGKVPAAPLLVARNL